MSNSDTEPPLSGENNSTAAQPSSALYDDIPASSPPSSSAYDLVEPNLEPQQSLYNTVPTKSGSSVNSSVYGDSVEGIYNNFTPGVSSNDTPSEGLTIDGVGDILKIKLENYKEKARIPVKDIFGRGLKNKAFKKGTLIETYKFYDNIMNNNFSEYAHYIDSNKYYIAIPYSINGNNALIMPKYTTYEKEYNFYQCWVKGGSTNFDEDEVNKILEKLSNGEAMGDKYMTHAKLVDGAIIQSDDGKYVLFYVKDNKFFRIDNVIEGDIQESEQRDIVDMMTN